MPDQATCTANTGGVGRTWWSTVAVVILAGLVLTACAAGVNTATDVPAADGDVAGFWLGLWHGLIAPITFIISLFSDTVGVYEVHNNGGWYDFGFLLGASSALGGGGAGAGSRR
jgi:hypothetical protein